MVFRLIEINPKIIKFEQVGPDICPFMDLNLAIGGHLVNLLITNLYCVKCTTQGENDDSRLY